MKPLQVGQPRTPDADSDFLEVNLYDFFFAIGAPVRSLAPDDSTVLETLWGADVEAGEIFPLAGSPPGDLQEHIQGREGTVVSVAGYRGADSAWRFETTTDGGHTWRQTDVQLPLGRQRILPDAYASPYAVGPGSFQALAVADYGIDLPLHLRQLWRTDDERQFRRVPLPRDQMPFAGMAFASDGARSSSPRLTTPNARSRLSCAPAEERSGAWHRKEAQSTHWKAAPPCSALTGRLLSKQAEESSSRKPDTGRSPSQPTGTHGPRSPWAVRRARLSWGLPTPRVAHGCGHVHASRPAGRIGCLATLHRMCLNQPQRAATRGYGAHNRGPRARGSDRCPEGRLWMRP